MGWWSHGRVLVIASRNTSDLGRDRVDAIGFDFVAAGECHRFDECAAYARLYGEPVIDIEYSDDLRGMFADACAASDAAASTILRDRDLKKPSGSAQVVDYC